MVTRRQGCASPEAPRDPPPCRHGCPGCFPSSPASLAAPLRRDRRTVVGDGDPEPSVPAQGQRSLLPRQTAPTLLIQPTPPPGPTRSVLVGIRDTPPLTELHALCAHTSKGGSCEGRSEREPWNWRRQVMQRLCPVHVCLFSRSPVSVYSPASHSADGGCSCQSASGEDTPSSTHQRPSLLAVSSSPVCLRRRQAIRSAPPAHAGACVSIPAGSMSPVRAGFQTEARPSSR